jgi:hypothetical protein
MPGLAVSFLLVANRIAPVWLLVTLAFASSAALLLAYERRWTNVGERVPWFAWLSASALHVAFLFHEPILSGDVWRYLFDGALQAEWLHPWSYPPSSPKVADLRASIPGVINHPELRSVYPPFAELLFGIVGWLGGNLIVWKAIAFSSLIAATSLLRRHRGSHDAFLLYGHPLSVLAISSEAHVDIVGVLALVLFSYATLGALSRGLAVGAAIGTKLIPILILPRLLNGTKKQAAAGAAGCALIILLSALPYLHAGSAAFNSLGSYLSEWSFNGSIAPLAIGGITKAVDLATQTETFQIQWLSSVFEHLDYTVVFNGQARAESWWTANELARLIYRALAGLLLMCAAWRARRMVLREQALVVVFSCWLLLSPVVHPWYLLWLLPFAFGDSAWHAAIRAWSVTVLLAYLAPAWQHDSGQWHLPVWIPVIEYGIPLVVYLRHRWLNGKRTQAAT